MSIHAIMEVTLERVQFKFASIIGELCSHPEVLSQFAVWLDLRLAEYKFKGAISLECSGEEPDPIWLKGLNKLKQQIASNSQSDRRTPRYSPAASRFSSLERSAQQSPVSDIPVTHTQTGPNVDVGERLSNSPDDVVVVKEEPSDSFAVPLQFHENRVKRPANDDISDDFSEHSTYTCSSITPSKQRKLLSTESASNQSLLSVIGGFNNEAEEGDIRGDNDNSSQTAQQDDSKHAAELCVDASLEDISLLNDSVSDWKGQPGTSQNIGSNSVPKWALLLFDADGCTHVTKTTNLAKEGNVHESSVLDFHHGKDVYKVEVLALSDNKQDLDKFENDWQESERSERIQQARNQHQINGYLRHKSHLTSTSDAHTLDRLCVLPEFPTPQKVNIGSVRHPIVISRRDFQKIVNLPNVQRFVLATMDLIFTNKEMAESSVFGGVVKYKGVEICKKALCPHRMSAIYKLASRYFDRSAEDISRDQVLRNAINSKCRNKRLLVAE